MEERIITFLDQNEWRIIKNIHIISDTKYGETVIGNIFYKRFITDNYKLKKQKEEDDKNGGVSFIRDYPRQENYPQDDIDMLIFNSIKSLYPKSQVTNDLLLFNTDKRNLELWKNRPKFDSKLFFTPIFEDYSVDNLVKLKSDEFINSEIPIKIYTFNPNEFIANTNFNIRYPLNRKELITKITQIEFE